MTDQVRQIFAEGNKITLLTEHGRIYQGNKSGEKAGVDGRLHVPWNELELPPGCEPGLSEPELHTELLQSIAGKVGRLGPGGTLSRGETAELFEMVKEFYE